MKPLIVYYSFEGNCRTLARAMSEATGGDVLEIRPRVETPKGLVMKYVKGGRASLRQEAPDIEPFAVDVGAYDLVVAGGPVWAFNMAPPVRTFLKQMDWNNRRAALFVMHRGGAGNALRNMRRMVEDGGGEVVDAAEFFDLRRRDADKTKAAAEAWATAAVQRVAGR